MEGVWHKKPANDNHHSCNKPLLSTSCVPGAGLVLREQIWVRCRVLPQEGFIVVFSSGFFFFFGHACGMQKLVPGPGIEPAPQQRPKPQQWQCWLLKQLSRQGTPWSEFWNRCIWQEESLDHGSEDVLLQLWARLSRADGQTSQIPLLSNLKEQGQNGGTFSAYLSFSWHKWPCQAWCWFS